MTPRDVLDMFRRKGGARCIEVGRLIQGYLEAKFNGDRGEVLVVQRKFHAMATCSRSQRARSSASTFRAQAVSASISSANSAY